MITYVRGHREQAGSWHRRIREKIKAKMRKDSGRLSRARTDPTKETPGKSDAQPRSQSEVLD